MNGISRRKNDWLVRCVYKNKKPQFQKAFVDDFYGSKDLSLKAAIEYRDSVLEKSSHKIGENKRARFFRNGFLREPTTTDYLFVKNYTEFLIRGRRFDPIRSDLTVEEIVQSALLSYCSIKDSKLTDKTKYLQIQVGIGLRRLLFQMCNCKVTTGIDSVCRDLTYEEKIKYDY
jgi:hypothetical protein